MAKHRAEMESAMFQIAGLIVTGALFVVGYQIFQWLRFGIWKPISVVTALQWFEVSWAFDAREWVGVHKLLDFIPLSLALVLLSIVPILIVVAWPAEQRTG